MAFPHQPVARHDPRGQFQLTIAPVDALVISSKTLHIAQIQEMRSSKRNILTRKIMNQSDDVVIEGIIENLEIFLAKSRKMQRTAGIVAAIQVAAGEPSAVHSAQAARLLRVPSKKRLMCATSRQSRKGAADSSGTSREAGLPHESIHLPCRSYTSAASFSPRAVARGKWPDTRSSTVSSG